MMHANPALPRWWIPLVGLWLALGATGVVGQGCDSASISATASASRFTDNGNGTVTDTASGLVWKRFSEGQTWGGATCAGVATTPAMRGQDCCSISNAFLVISP